MYQFSQPAAPGRPGYRIAYRLNEVNHCPGCGQTQWIVGRIVAECAFCSTAIPLNASGMNGTGLFRACAHGTDALAA